MNERPRRFDIAIVGGVDVGKTSIALAISRAMGVNAPALVIGSERFVFNDPSSHRDQIEWLVTAGPRPQAIILVISAVEGPTRQTQLLARIIRLIGISRISIAFTHCDTVYGSRLLEMTQVETRRMLLAHDFALDIQGMVVVNPRAALDGDDRQPAQIRRLAVTVSHSCTTLPRLISPYNE